MGKAKRGSKVFCGIDEAGLGPLLGPLSIGYAFFEAPEGAGLRRAFGNLCVGDPAKLRERDARTVVCDSKLLHRGPGKLAKLERTALAFFTAARGGAMPATFGEILLSGLTRAESLLSHPWYRELDAALPAAAARRDVERRAARLMRAMDKRKIRILELGARLLPERELNELFAKTNNKSVALFESVIPVLKLAGAHAARNPILVCDRQGGRMSYAPLLSRAFDGAWVRVAREKRDESLYCVRTPEGNVRVAFATNGESRAFACALASCVAKYARELAMHRFNAYFAKVAPEVKPTAGYFRDGKRFLAAAHPSLVAAGIDPSSLRRAR